jgi:hypothetical protein
MDFADQPFDPLGLPLLHADLLLQGGQLPFDLLLHQEGQQDAGEGDEEHRSGIHEADGDDPSRERDRKDVPVGDRRDRRNPPPQAVEIGAHARVDVPLQKIDRRRREDQDQVPRDGEVDEGGMKKGPQEFTGFLFEKLQEADRWLFRSTGRGTCSRGESAA